MCEYVAVCWSGKTSGALGDIRSLMRLGHLDSQSMEIPSDANGEVDRLSSSDFLGFQISHQNSGSGHSRQRNRTAALRTKLPFGICFGMTAVSPNRTFETRLCNFRDAEISYCSACYGRAYDCPNSWGRPTHLPPPPVPAKMKPERNLLPGMHQRLTLSLSPKTSGSFEFDPGFFRYCTSAVSARLSARSKR